MTIASTACNRTGNQYSAAVVGNFDYNGFRNQVSTQVLNIRVNGERRDVACGSTILTLLENLGLRPDRVAVELNRAILKQPLWAETEVPPEAEIEIVQFVGGG
jgi:thiamine biosynthesis protein ThiS